MELYPTPEDVENICADHRRLIEAGEEVRRDEASALVSELARGIHMHPWHIKSGVQKSNGFIISNHNCPLFFFAPISLRNLAKSDDTLPNSHPA